MYNNLYYGPLQNYVLASTKSCNCSKRFHKHYYKMQGKVVRSPIWIKTYWHYILGTFLILRFTSKKHSKDANQVIFHTYLVLMVGISKLLLLLCTGKESLERARARLLSEVELVLKVEVALNTSAMKFHPRLTTFSSGLDFSDPSWWSLESEWEVGWRLGLRSGWQLTLGP